ncbi:hypothetical protein [Bradyrhizobium sp. UFLA05-112]
MAIITALLINSAQAETYSYICMDHGKSYPLKVDEEQSTLAWKGGTYKISRQEECAKYGWRAVAGGASFDFCTATKGYADFVQNGTRIECDLQRAAERAGPSNSSSKTSSAELPKTFHGSWTNKDGSSEFEVTGIYVGPRTYHEPGYNCDIKSVAAKKDAATVTQSLVYLINMTCAGEGEKTGKQVREIWALRKVDGKDVLVMAGAAGPTFPSIHVLQRDGE